MGNTKINILLVEDEEYDVRRVRNTLKLFEDRILLKNVVSDGNSALDILTGSSSEYDVVIMDYQIAGGLRGEQLIRKIKEIDPALQIIVITKLTINLTDFEFANSLMKAGAFWYCTKYPGDIEEYIYQPTDFLMSILNAFEKRILERESNVRQAKLSRNVGHILDRKKIIGNSPQAEELRGLIEQAALSDVNILISGPSGTGKELVASNIHYRSNRQFENFIPINCGSLPGELIESELFGYEKGAFTGAAGRKPGLFETANKGTIFLDEICELPLFAQVKLLRVIQDGEIRRVGGTHSKRINVRILAATNKDIELEVKEKRFREDLYFRLNVIPIKTLPLRDRSEEIPPLIHSYLEFYSKEMGVPIPEIEVDAMDLLTKYKWPGNVRELKNIVQRFLFYRQSRVDRNFIRKVLMGGETEIPNNNDLFNFNPETKLLPLKDIERELRLKYFIFIRNSSDSDAEAAEKLGLAPPNFHRMCKELGLK